MFDSQDPAVDRDLYSGLMRLHILHHAVEGPVFGLGMLEELGRHGYRISPGTLYPLLHGLEKKGYIKSKETAQGQVTAQGVSCDTLGAQSSGRRQTEGARIHRRTVRRGRVMHRWALGLIAASFACAQPGEMTIAQAVDRALGNYPAIRVTQEQMNAAAAGIRLAQTAYLHA